MEDYTAAAVVMPETVKEIQAVLRVANETGTYRPGRGVRRLPDVLGVLRDGGQALPGRS